MKKNIVKKRNRIPEPKMSEIKQLPKIQPPEKKEKKIPEPKMSEIKQLPKIQPPEKKEKEIVYVRDASAFQKPTVKYVGRTSDVDDTKKAVIFLSKHKSLMINADDGSIYMFSNNHFFTNDSKAKEVLRSCGAFNFEMWEGQYPKDFVAKKKIEDQYLTRDPYEHDPMGVGIL